MHSLAMKAQIMLDAAQPQFRDLDSLRHNCLPWMYASCLLQHLPIGCKSLTAVGFADQPRRYWMLLKVMWRAKRRYFALA